MTQNAKVAVIIPAWNAEETIDACVSAILASTRQPDEVILYNDGSTLPKVLVRAAGVIAARMKQMRTFWYSSMPMLRLMNTPWSC